MRKRIWAYLLTLVMIVGLFPVSVLAAETEVEISINDGAEKEEYEFYSINETTPYKMDSYIKPAIEAEVERLGIDKDDITSLTISTSGDVRLKFADCCYIAQELKGLTTLDITEADFFDDTYAGNWLEATNTDHKIPEYAFWDACTIERIYPFSGNSRNVDTKFTKIGNDAFSGTKLKGEIVIPDTITEVSGFNRTKISGINKKGNVNYFDGNIEVIGQACLYNAKNIEGGVAFGENLKAINAMAFQNSSISGDIILGGSITEIGSNAFQGCKQIQSVRVKANVEKYETTAAFQGCSLLEYVIFEDGATVRIGQNTFTGCDDLAYVYCGDNVIYETTVEKHHSSFSGPADKNVVLTTEQMLDPAKISLSELDGGIVYVGKADILDGLAKEWEITKSKIVIADMKGGRLSDQEIYSEKNVLAEPYKKGYQFDSWYAVDADEKLVGTPEIGKVYYAKWTLEKPEISVKGDADKTYDGKSVVLSVPEIDGAVYEWYKEDITDVISDKNTLELKEVADSGIYFCKITVGAESVTTDAQVITIEKADPALTLSADSGSCRINRGPATFTYTSDSTGEVKVVSSDDTIATASVSGDTVTMELKAIGTAIITVSVAGDENHTDGTATYQLTVQKKKKSSSSDSSSGTGSSATEQEHSVSKADGIDNGKVKTDPAKAEKGDKVTVTVTPDEGYVIDRVVVKDADGKKIELTEKGEGKYTFTMPDSKVEIDAKFVKAEAEPAAPEEIPAAEKIVLTINERVSQVFGNAMVNDVAPVIRGERTMLPIRFIAQALGAEVAWDDALNKVTITKEDGTIELYIGSPVAVVNGENIELDAPAFIENSRTYLPLRFVAEHLGAKVLWDAETQQVTILPQP